MSKETDRENMVAKLAGRETITEGWVDSCSAASNRRGRLLDGVRHTTIMVWPESRWRLTPHRLSVASKRDQHERGAHPRRPASGVIAQGGTVAQGGTFDNRNALLSAYLSSGV